MATSSINGGCTSNCAYPQPPFTNFSSVTCVSMRAELTAVPTNPQHPASPFLTPSPCVPITTTIAAAATTTTTTTANFTATDTDTTDFSCPHCPRTFISRIDLVGQLRIHRTSTGEPVPEAPTCTRRIHLHPPHPPPLSTPPSHFHAFYPTFGVYVENVWARK
ncbi:hypothetical protein SprV_0100111800 [Sparganum proliferum]